MEGVYSVAFGSKEKENSAVTRRSKGAVIDYGERRGRVRNGRGGGGAGDKSSLTYGGPEVQLTPPPLQILR